MEGESDERFAKRIERAKKKKSRIVVSHHKHHLFGAGRQSYEKVVDSYAEAMATQELRTTYINREQTSPLNPLNPRKASR